MRWGHRFSGILFIIIGLSVVQSHPEDKNQTSGKVQPVNDDHVTIDAGIVPPAVNGFDKDQFFANHSSPTEPNSPSKNSTALFPLLVLHGESDGLTVSNMSDTKNRRVPPLLNETDINIYSVDFHWTKGFIFYSTEEKIFRANFILGNHSLSATQVIVNDTQMARLAVDWVHDRLFWMSDKYQTVEVADLDGANRALIIDNVKPFKYPNNIAVDPYENALFFVSYFSVYTSSLNGSKLKRVSLDQDKRGLLGGGGVRCLALDRRHRRLYLTGGNQPTNNISSTHITRANYNGSEVTFLEGAATARNWSNIFGIEVFGDTLYLAHYDKNHSTDQDPDSLWTVDLNTNKTQKRFVPKSYTSVMWSIRAFHPEVQIKQQLPKNCTCI